VRFGFRINRIEKEASGIVSIYISGKNLSRFNAKPGQFIMIRILDRQYWLQEHPFSLSMVTAADEMRITVKNSGDYTAMIQTLKPGSRVIVAGPYGAFTKAKAITAKKLYLAGGIGITPLRSMIEEGVSRGDDALLLWGNKTSAEEVFRNEFNKFEQGGLRAIRFLSDETKAGYQSGRITRESIKQFVPDVIERSIYICGPPPFMAALEHALTDLGVPKSQIYTEKFSLTS
jgi:predicted ferric reductase